MEQQQARLLLMNIRFMRRFLDDILLLTIFRDHALVTALFTTGGLVREIPGLYPPCLSIQDTSSGTEYSGEFMDLDIQWFAPTRCFHTAVFDKRNSPQYRAIPNIITVPSAHSCLAGTCKWGVVFSQLWRFRLLCTTPTGWVQATQEFYIRNSYGPDTKFKLLGIPFSALYLRLPLTTVCLGRHYETPFGILSTGYQVLFLRSSPCKHSRRESHYP